jgi:bifunctional UDP-N-acetylglucosamine pyrophosphorylase / glucosamine-1-phosphate N-acetyltransferase
MREKRAAVILAAGQGSRMRSGLPKVLHAVGGRAMLDWSVAMARAALCDRLVIVANPAMEDVKARAVALAGADGLALQHEPKGTGHAVLAAKQALAGHEGAVAVLYGDTPLIQAETVAQMFALRAEKGGIVVLGFEAGVPTGYGRLILDEQGRVARIVEEKDATDDERAVKVCNSGVFVADATILFNLLSMVRNDNAKGEYYLTDIVGLGRSSGFFTHLIRCPENEVLGVNSRVDLAGAEAVFQARARRAALEAGVTMIDPNAVYFSHDTQIAQDVVIEPGVVFGTGVRVETGAVIHAYSHIAGAHIGPGAKVGPFARLRPGTELGRAVKIGNFVEVKNAVFGEKAQASHLTYVGDADVGAGANLGAGTITCNYDGFDKHRTVIGAGAFIGSDTALVAPVTVGAGAYTGSGSVITKDVPDDALAVARGELRMIHGWAAKFRARKLANRKKGEA